MTLRRAGPVSLVGGFLAALSGLVGWLSSTDALGLRHHLAVVTPYSLHLSFLLLLIGAWTARGEIRRSFKGTVRLAGLVALAAWILVATLPPRTHRIFYDEDIYQNVAQNILWSGRAEMCNEGLVEHGTFECLAGEYNKEPNAFPFLLAWVFRFTGVREGAAHFVNHVLFCLGVLSAFWLGLLLFETTGVAMAASLLYALAPQNLLWGSTVAVEPGSAAFAGFGLGAWILFFREKTVSTAVLASAAVSFAAQWRPESILLVALAGVAVFILSPESLRRRRLWAVALLVLVLLIPHLTHLWAVRAEGWGAHQGNKFSWEFVPKNLEANAAYYVEGKELPLTFTLLAFLGLIAPGRYKERFFLLLWWLLFFGVFIPFHAGSYRYGADIRFSMLSSLPFSLLGGFGAEWLAKWLGRISPGGRLVSWVPHLGVVYSFTAYLPLVGSLGAEAWAARGDHDAAREIVERLPESSIVLTHNPGMLQVMGQSAAQASTAKYQPPAVDEYFRRFPGGVYFHFNFWCNVDDPVQNDFCNHILQTYPTQVEGEWSAGTYRFVLYRLMPRRDVPGPPP